MPNNLNMSEALITSVAFPQIDSSIGGTITPHVFTSSKTINATSSFKAIFCYAYGFMPYDDTSSIHDSFNSWVFPPYTGGSSYGGVRINFTTATITVTVHDAYSNGKIIILCIE